MALADYLVSSEDRAAYARDGVVCLRGVIAPDEVAHMREACLELMAASGGYRLEVQDGREKGRFFMTAFMSLMHPPFRAFAHGSALPAVAAQLMGSDEARFFYDQLFIKEPGTSAPTHWHNDLPFWPFRGEDIVSLWVALTPAKRETSGLEYVRGSHRWNRMFQALTPDRHPAFIDAALEPCPNYSDPALRGDVEVVSWDMQPGDVLAHHPMAAHGAGGNRSQTNLRIGLSVRYFGRDVQWDPRPHVMPLPIVPEVAPGAFPADERAFPRVWPRPQDDVRSPPAAGSRPADGEAMASFTLIGADAQPYESETPGELGGHRKLKGYGRLDCPSARRWIARGQYVRHRVFFADEATAVAAGYRPCARCLPERYAAWKADPTGFEATMR